MENIINKCDNELKFNKIDGFLAIFMIGYVFLSLLICKYIIFDLELWSKFIGYFHNRFFGKFLFYIPINLFQVQAFISVIPKMVIHVYFVGIYKAGGNSVLSSTITHGINNFIANLY